MVVRIHADSLNNSSKTGASILIPEKMENIQLLYMKRVINVLNLSNRIWNNQVYKSMESFKEVI